LLEQSNYENNPQKINALSIQKFKNDISYSNGSPRFGIIPGSIDFRTKIDVENVHKNYLTTGYDNDDDSVKANAHPKKLENNPLK
jgi:hypothetical protein